MDQVVSAVEMLERLEWRHYGRIEAGRRGVVGKPADRFQLLTATFGIISSTRGAHLPGLRQGARLTADRAVAALLCLYATARHRLAGNAWGWRLERRSGRG